MRELISTRTYKAGYVIKTEKVSGLEAGGGKPFVMKTAFTPNGEYIGNPRFAYRLVVKRGIKPELISPKSNVCSIGFCAKQKRWFGWYHRAIHGFKIGDVVKKGDCTAESLRVGFKAKTVADTKKMAIAFARSVS